MSRRRRAPGAAPHEKSFTGDHHKNSPLSQGDYRLTFHVADYFAKSGRESFFSEVVVNFRVAGGTEHYHVPLLLSPFGYSTYRGS